MAKNLALFNRRKARTRYKVKQHSYGRLRLSVFRSHKHIYAQLIDDAKGVTVVSASSLDADVRKSFKLGGNLESAAAVGTLLAKRAKEAKITEVAFDRGGYLFHGRVKSLADAARAGGLNF